MVQPSIFLPIPPAPDVAQIFGDALGPVEPRTFVLQQKLTLCLACSQAGELPGL
jgi:hypothetical protein